MGEIIKESVLSMWLPELDSSKWWKFFLRMRLIPTSKQTMGAAGM